MTSRFNRNDVIEKETFESFHNNAWFKQKYFWNLRYLPKKPSLISKEIGKTCTEEKSEGCPLTYMTTIVTSSITGQCPCTVTVWAMFNLQSKSSLTFLTILNKTHDMNPVHRILKLNIRKQLAKYLYDLQKKKIPKEKNTMKAF